VTTSTSGEFLDLPPHVGRRIRSAGAAMGAGQLLAGIVIAAVSGGLAGGQHSLADPLWVINLVGVIPPLLLVVLGVHLFRARGCVRGDRMVVADAGRVRGGLRGVWVAVLVTAVLVVAAQAVGLVLAHGNAAVVGNLSLLDDVAFAVPVVTVVVGMCGFLVGRNLLPPPPEVLAKAWAAAG
jgi:hypothetical protein